MYVIWHVIMHVYMREAVDAVLPVIVSTIVVVYSQLVLCQMVGVVVVMYDTFWRKTSSKTNGDVVW